MLISVVIPVYNSEEYLTKCLDSIVNQTYKNIEIIILNDGSTDNSKQIIKSYKNKYSNIRFYDKENTGVSDTRNQGIKYSRGDYIMFLDADDWIDSSYIEKCVDNLKNQKVDILLTAYIREYPHKSVKNNIFAQKKILCLEKEKTRNLLFRKLFGPIGKQLERPAAIDDLSPCWGKLYRADICKKVKFEDLSKVGAEDIWFNINYNNLIQTFIYDGNIFYHYNKSNVNSLIHKKGTDVFKKRDKLYKAMNDFIKRYSLGNDYYEALNNRIIVDLIGISNNIYSAKANFYSKYNDEKKILSKEIYIKLFKNFDFHFLPFRWRIFFDLCKKRQVLTLSIFVMAGTKLKPLLK